MHIPDGTLIDIQPFRYSLGCRVDSYDLIRSEGFIGGTTNVRSYNANNPTVGTWKKSTSNQYIMRIEFKSDSVGYCKGEKYGFKMPFSQLRRKKATIYMQDNCMSKS